MQVPIHIVIDKFNINLKTTFVFSTALTIKERV